jgi:hypothetical protein
MMLMDLPVLVVTAAGCLVGLAITEREERRAHGDTSAPGGRYRWTVVALLFVASMAHVPVIPEHLSEAPYMGQLFIAFSLAAYLLAAVITMRPSGSLYAAAGLLSAAAIVAYVCTRLVAFPLLAEDVGRWTEPLGLVSITAEAGVVVASVLALRGRREHEAAMRLPQELHQKG